MKFPFSSLLMESGCITLLEHLKILRLLPPRAAHPRVGVHISWLIKLSPMWLTLHSPSSLQTLGWYRMAPQTSYHMVGLSDMPSPHPKLPSIIRTHHKKQRHCCHSGDWQNFEARFQELGMKASQILYYTIVIKSLGWFIMQHYCDNCWHTKCLLQNKKNL